MCSLQNSIKLLKRLRKIECKRKGRITLLTRVIHRVMETRGIVDRVTVTRDTVIPTMNLKDTVVTAVEQVLAEEMPGEGVEMIGLLMADLFVGVVEKLVTLVLSVGRVIGAEAEVAQAEDKTLGVIRQAIEELEGAQWEIQLTH
jgi:hypothetical protein